MKDRGGQGCNPRSPEEEKTRASLSLRVTHGRASPRRNNSRRAGWLRFNHAFVAVTDATGENDGDQPKQCYQS
jgi:hypothetical protein